MGALGRYEPAKVKRRGQAAPAPNLWDKRIWDRYVWKQTEWTQMVAHDATIEVLLLAECDAFVGKFTSNLFRLAYSLRAAKCNCAAPFISLDAPWCFDFGLREGRNFRVAGAGYNNGTGWFSC